MLRSANSLALSLRGTFVDTLLRKDFSLRRYPSYGAPWRLPRPDFHRLDNACLAGHAKKEKRALWTDTYYWAPLDVTMFSYVVPVYIKGKFIGVAGMDLDFYDYEQAIRKIKLYQSGYAALLNPQLNFQVHPQLKAADNLTKVYNGALRGLAKKIHQSNQGTYYARINGEKQIISFAHLENGGIVLLFAPAEQALSAMIELRWLLISLSMLLSIFAILLSIFFGRRISIPIAQASAHATLISEGDFSQAIPDSILNRQDEIGQLGQALAKMTCNLQSMLTNIQKTAQDLARSEEKYSKAFHYSGEIIGIIRNSDQRYIEVSDAFYKIFEYNPEEVIGQTSREIGLWRNAADRDQMYFELGQNKHFYDFEVQWNTKFRVIKTGICSAEIVDIAGEPCIIYVYHDITERKQAELALRRAHDELEIRVQERTQDLFAANQELQAINLELSDTIEELKMTQQQLVQSEKMASLGNLVAGVAHEVSTPIGVAVTTASHLKQITDKLTHCDPDSISQLIIDEYLEDCSEASQIILKNLERAASLIRGFKQVSVDQSSEVRRFFNVKEYLNEILMSLHPILKKTRLNISIHCDKDLQINTFPGALAQIITNLITNSLTHAYEPNDTGQITIAVVQVNERLEIRFADDGKGMDADVLHKIFDPFYTTKRASGGTGLGLFIVYNIVTMKLGGTIECSSKPGKGTGFIISFPL